MDDEEPSTETGGSPTTTVRDGQPADAESIQRVARASWHAAYDEVLGAETVDALLGDWYALRRLRRALDAERPFLVAVVNATEAEEVIGFTSGREADGHGSLERLYVHPDYWHGGVGTALLGRLLAALPDATTLEAEVLAANESAIEFYRTRGFEERTRRESNLPGHDFEVCEIVGSTEEIRAHVDGADG